VRRFEGVADLAGNLQRLGGRKTRSGRPQTAQTLLERLAVHELHRDRDAAGVFLEPMHGRNVGMVEGGEHFGFAAKTRDALGIGGDIGGEHFDGDVALQARVPRPVDLAHSACAQRSNHFVWAEAGTFNPHGTSGMTQSVAHGPC
jgi:hypothetical protein